jgi:nucleoside 2-deoxyribosyltransferase
MIIRGILDKSLSKQTCIRGFARIKELARVSKANPEYQRELLDRQKKVISNFLTEENYLFFPEVILSVKLKYDYTKASAKKISPLTLIESKKAFKSNIDSLSIKPSEKKYPKTFDTSGRRELKVVELEFEEGELLTLIEQNLHPFHRIDGNHRLSAAEQIKGDRIDTMDVPFCIVLFEETTTSVFNPNTQVLEATTDKSYEKFERVVFFNINSKTEPLTLEQNLKGILGANQYFNDEEISNIFGANGSNARKLGQRINIEDYANIKHLLKDNKWSLCLNIFKLYTTHKSKVKSISNDKLEEAVFSGLQAINILYGEEPNLNKNKSVEILLAFIFYKSFAEVKSFAFFSKWILTNHLFNAVETKADSIIKIFDKINNSREIKVFVAMPYYNDAKVNEYNKLFKEALSEIQKKAKSEVEIKLIPIMRFKGKSERIDTRLLAKIKECDIFIADHTGCNENVSFEIAYAEGSGKSIVIIKSSKDNKKAPFDMDKLQYIPFAEDSYYSSIKSIVTNNVTEILKEQFAVHF